MDNNNLKSAAEKELLRRAAQKELERRRSSVVQTPDVQADTPKMSYEEIGSDIAKGGTSGIVKGLTNLAGGFGDVQEMAGDVFSWGAGKLGLPPETQSAAKYLGERLAIPGMGKMPTSEVIRKPVEEITGPLPEAETLPGQVVERFGEYAPSAILGPGGFVRRVASAAVPAVTSEFAGRIPGVEGSPYQPYVETAAGLVTGLPIASGGKGEKLNIMRQKAPKHEEVSQLTDEAYKAIEKAGIMFDSVSVRRAVSDIKLGLKNRGLEDVSGSEVAPFFRRAEGLLKGTNSRNWSNVDRILSEAKEFLRSDANAAVKGDVRVIVDNLEKLVKSGKITSQSGLSREEINNSISKARELARRNILAREIEKMKRRLPGYLSGDESAFRNQFGAYLKSPEGGFLSPAEVEAFSRVVSREGPLNIATSMGSRIGQIAGSTSGAGVGAFTGSALGPAGTIGGAIAGAAVTAATQNAIRKVMENITEKAVNDAMKTVLAGREAQGKAMKEEQIEAMKAIIRSALVSEAATNPIEENWFLQSLSDQQKSTQKTPEQSSGGRVARKSGGRISMNPISAEVKRVRALLSEKTASMLSVPDDAIATALHIAKRT